MAASWAPLKSAELGTRLHSQKGPGLGQPAERGSQLPSSPWLVLGGFLQQALAGTPRRSPNDRSSSVSLQGRSRPTTHTEAPHPSRTGKSCPSYLRRADPGSRCRVLQPKPQGGKRKGETGPCRSTRQRGPGSEFTEPLSPGARIGLARPETLFFYYDFRPRASRQRK